MKELVQELLEKCKKISLICEEPADNMQVLEMQTRILRVLAGKDEQPKEKIKRSECKGIDCAWCMEDCE